MEFVYAPGLLSLGVSQSPAHLVPGLGWCANGKTQAKNHAWGLGNDADQVEGGWGLVWGTGEKWEEVSHPELGVYQLNRSRGEVWG
jgi:hypothetical protein